MKSNFEKNREQVASTIVFYRNFRLSLLAQINIMMMSNFASKKKKSEVLEELERRSSRRMKKEHDEKFFEAFTEPFRPKSMWKRLFSNSLSSADTKAAMAVLHDAIENNNYTPSKASNSTLGRAVDDIKHAPMRISESRRDYLLAGLLEMNEVDWFIALDDSLTLYASIVDAERGLELVAKKMLNEAQFNDELSKSKQMTAGKGGVAGSSFIPSGSRYASAPRNPRRLDSSPNHQHHYAGGGAYPGSGSSDFPYWLFLYMSHCDAQHELSIYDKGNVDQLIPEHEVESEHHGIDGKTSDGMGGGTSVEYDYEYQHDITTDAMAAVAVAHAVYVHDDHQHEQEHAAADDTSSASEQTADLGAYS